MILIRHERRPAAAVTLAGIQLTGCVAVLEVDHPVRRWIVCQAFFALDVLRGEIPGPYDRDRASHFARCALIADDEFAALYDWDDVDLAELFNVPLPAIREKRTDLIVRATGDSSLPF